MKAEDDTELMHLSVYEEEKDLKAKQEEYIKERIRDQNKSEMKKKLTESSMKNDEDGLRQVQSQAQSQRDPNKIKRPRFNLAKEGALRDRNTPEKNIKHAYDTEEDEKEDPKIDKNQSMRKVYESYGRIFS